MARKAIRSNSIKWSGKFAARREASSRSLQRSGSIDRKASSDSFRRIKLKSEEEAGSEFTAT